MTGSAQRAQTALAVFISDRFAERSLGFPVNGAELTFADERLRALFPSKVSFLLFVSRGAFLADAANLSEMRSSLLCHISSELGLGGGRPGRRRASRGPNGTPADVFPKGSRFISAKLWDASPRK